MKKLKNLTKYNKSKAKLNSNEPKLNDIACPECGAELFDSKPMIVLTSYPAQKNVHCEKCGYKGYRNI